ncbi:MAG: AtpZ/AtpI family protein [Acidobacteriota bacterium]
MERKDEDKKRADLPGVWRSAGPYLGIGWFFVISILGGLFLGKWLDKKFYTEPWLMLAGIALGLFLGFYNLIKVVLHEGKK